MARGPAPRSPDAKKARGNPGKRAATQPAVMAQTIGDIVPDAKLRPRARHIWNRLAPELHRLNVLRPTDCNALSRYCEDMAQYYELTEALRKEGNVYEVQSLHGTYRRTDPRVAILDRVQARLIVMEDRFGLSPQARQSLMIRAVQIATQGQLPFGEASPQDPASPDAPPPPDSPIGFLSGLPTRH